MKSTVTLQALTDSDLERASGGAEGGAQAPNTTQGKFNVGIDARGAKIGVQGEYSQARTDYAKCLTTMAGAGADPKTIGELCGKPGESR